MIRVALSSTSGVAISASVAIVAAMRPNHARVAQKVTASSPANAATPGSISASRERPNRSIVTAAGTTTGQRSDQCSVPSTGPCAAQRSAASR